MTDASGDWAPLPSNDLCARPGETCDVRKKEAPPPPAPPPPPPPPNPAAERALAALKQKLAATAPATSLVASVQHREQRAERKRKAATAAPACAETIVKAAEPVVPAADVAAPAEPVAAADAETDPRENEKWFRALPHTEKERLRARWWLAKHRHDGNGIVLRKRLERAVCHGALCFFVLSALQSLLLGGFAFVPLFTAAGALAGGVAEISRGGRFAYAGAGVAAYLAVMGPAILTSPFCLCTLMIAAYGMGLIGMDGEMRRSGGFREK